MPRSHSGSASVEHLGLATLLALLILAAVSALLAAPPGPSARRLGSAIARRLACAPRHPVPCGRNPLALAYGFPVGKLVRWLAPVPGARPGPGGTALLPVDFRYCRRESCALPGPRPGLTASGRRVTAFTSVEDARPSGGALEVRYWLYRPLLGWRTLLRRGGEAELEAASALRLDLEDDPALVPLETLPGRNHYRFAAGEEPPWRWRVAPSVP
jgi:hypothetical protein